MMEIEDMSADEDNGMKIYKAWLDVPSKYQKQSQDTDAP
jgi:hypothetical protein